jgi:ADP-heptose:LPS heptosyltransferase
MTLSRPNILVIKLGALGDIIQSFGAFGAIRAHHLDAYITVLTTKPFADLFRTCPYTNEIVIDRRPKWYQPLAWLKLRDFLRTKNFTRIYDLQNNDRTALYLKLFWPGPAPVWVGVAPGASHRNTSPTRITGTAFAGHAQTLALAGITGLNFDDLAWLHGDITPLNLPKRYVVIVPGSSPQNPQKRWPIENYTVLSRSILGLGLTPIVIGTAQEKELGNQIAQTDPRILNLAGLTKIHDLPDLARGAIAAIGNDTGPMHLMAATGCPALTLFDTRYSNPQRHAPYGSKAMLLYADDIATITADQVLKTFKLLVPVSPENP